MTEAEVDKRLSALLKLPPPASDPAFVDRVLAGARLDRRIQLARKRAFRRSLVECGAAISVASTFYLLSQQPGAGTGEFIMPSGPAMAGLVMLFLWAAVALPMSASRQAFAP